MKLLNIALLGTFLTGTSFAADKQSGGRPLHTDVIRKVLISNIPQMRECYQTTLKQSKKPFEVRSRLGFFVAANGSVSKARVLLEESNEQTRKVSSCVLEVLKKIKFPESGDGEVVEVTQPMNFYPRKK